MRKVKKATTLEMVAISSLIFALISGVFFYVILFKPFMEGPTKGMDATKFCVVEKEKSGAGSFKSELSLTFDRVYKPDSLLIYVTPGGFANVQMHAEEIEVEVSDGKVTHSIGNLRNLQEYYIGTEVPCIGSRNIGWKKIDHCHPEDVEMVYSVTAKAKQSAWCNVPAALLCAIPIYGWIWCAYDFFSDGEMITVCTVDKLRVRMYYPCNYESTLIEGDCPSGAGWNHMYPIDCIAAADLDYSEVCNIEEGKYYTTNMDKIRQMPFPGLPVIRVGARAGCAGPQMGCGIDFYFGKPHDNDGCTDPLKVVWDKATTIENLDFDYIYSEPISIANYININDGSEHYRKWCLRVVSNPTCWINSIDVQRNV